MVDHRALPNHDQAAGLRRLFAPQERGLRVHPCVTPADGGDQFGFAIGLAGALVRLGRRVLVLDGEDGQIAPRLGLKARYDLRHLLSGDRTADIVALPAANGFRVLPAARALQDCARGQRSAGEFRRWLASLAPEFDDIVACTTVETLSPLMVDEAREFLLVCGAEPWQLARTYARIKLLHDRYPTRRFRIAYCPAESMRLAEDAHERLARATGLYLGLAIEFGGAIRSAARPGPERERPGHPIDGYGDEAVEQAWDQAASGLLIQGPPSPLNPALASAHDTADAAFLSVVESIADVYGQRHA